MRKKSFIYSGILIVALIILSVLVNQGVLQSLSDNAHVNLGLAAPPPSSQYLLGQTIKFNGSLDFINNEEILLHGVRLRTTNGPQGLDVLLPMLEGTHDISSLTDSLDDTLIVTVTYNNVTSGGTGGGTIPVPTATPGGTIPGSTLPGSTIPGSGELFTGTSVGASIDYDIEWTPGVMLDPPPVFTLIPSIEELFSIPVIPTPIPPDPADVLPNTTVQYAIPVVGAPSGTPLPNTEAAWGASGDIPQLTVSTNAPVGLPDLPSTNYATDGFDIPDLVALGLVPTPPSGVGSLPATTAGFDIPNLSTLGLVPTPPAGEPDLPGNVLAFAIPGGATPGGIAYDSSASFYIVTKGTGGSNNDQIVKVDSSGVVDGSWGTGGYVDAPSNNIAGIAYLDSMLWVLENQWRCFETVDPTQCDRAHRVFEMDPASPPSSDSGWGALNKIYASDQWDEMGGVSAKGSGSTGTLWLANKWGFRLYNIQQNGNEVNSFFTDQFVDGMDGVAYSAGPTTSSSDDFLMTSRNSNITQWSTSASKRQDFITSLSNVKGMTFIGSVLYIASSDGNVYKAFVGVNVTTNPRGITYSPSTASVGEAVWILVDGSPFDKILKVNPDTGALISSFGTNGAVDAPSNKTEGITFLGSSLYVIANNPGQSSYIYTINATSGAVSATTDLQNVNIMDELAGITNDGTNLIVHTKSHWNGLFVLDPNANFERTGIDGFPCCPSFNGAKGLAYHSGRDSYYAANGGSIGVYTSNFDLDTEVGLTESATPLSGIQGLAFNGDLMYVAHVNSGGKISKTFLATAITTKPRGMGFSSSSSTPGEALWILVDGTPLDKLMKVDPSTGLLISSFDTDGVIDAPSGQTEGITYLNTGDPTTSYLWIISNENSGRKLYKLNATTGATLSTYDLGNVAEVHDDLGGITNDGTNLIVYAKTFTSVWTLDPLMPINGAKLGQSHPCCANAFGAKALAYHSGRAQVFAAKSSSLLRLDSTNLSQIELEQNLLIDGSAASGVEGMVFSQDVIYVARNDGGTGKVSVGALRTTVTNQATAMAYTPTGTSVNGILVDRALWVLVDGTPFDQLLKVDPDTGALMTDFSADGAIETPSSKTVGLTYLDSSLWIGANDSNGTMLYKINPATGALQQTIKLNNCPSPCSFHENMGGLANDGTSLIAFAKSDSRAVYLDPTDGSSDDDKWGGGASINGGQSIAYFVARQQLFVGKNDRVVQYVVDGNDLFMADEYTTSLTDIRGMTFIDNGVLYIAHDTSGKVVKTAIPSDVSNNPNGLAYDADPDELYILVDGKAEDHVIVVNRVTGAQIRDFPVNDQSNTNAITFLDGSLYVAAEGEGFHGPPPRYILELDPNTGAMLNQLDANDLPGKVFGLDNNGTNLIAAPEHGGPHVEILDPSGGFRIDDIFFFDPLSNFHEEGFEGLAYRSDAEEYFPIKGNTVWRFNKNGKMIQEINVATAGFSNVKGAVFAGSQLYLAERGGNTIHATGIPVPPTVITSDPRGMATDGTNLYVIVDAEPRDKILKMDTAGNLDVSFGTGGVTDLPGTEAGGIAFHGGSLFVVTNDERTVSDPFGGFHLATFPVVHEIDPATAEEVNKFKIQVQDPSGPPWQLFDTIEALASDGIDLYLGLSGDQGMQGVWLKQNTSGSPAELIWEYSGQLPFMSGFQAFTMLPNSPFSSDQQLVASGPTGPSTGDADTIVRFDKNNGAMFREKSPGTTAGQFNISGTDLKGMAYIGLTLYVADDQTNKVYGTSLPENTIELTIAGNYDTKMNVQVSPDPLVPGVFYNYESVVASFSITRNPNVVAQFTTVETVSNGVVPLVQGFVLTDTATILNGRLNDPSIEEIEVGIRLPSTLLVDDQVQRTLSESLWEVSEGNAEWHIACEGDSFPARVMSSPCSWRYSVPDGPNYFTGAPTQGSMTTANSVEVNPGTRLEFFTGYATELSPDRDLKLVEVASVTTDLQGNEQVGAFNAIAQIVGKGGSDAYPPTGAHESFQFIEMDPLFVNPSMSFVNINLSVFAGQRVMIRFTFDSIDAFANDGEGWFLDDIKVIGSGFLTVIVPTTMLATPVVDAGSGETFYRTFSTPFDLAEGENEVGFQGKQPYSPFKKGFVLIRGFVDQTAPQVTLFGIPGFTSNLVQTLQGTVIDATFQSLDVIQTKPDGSTLVIFSTGSLPEDGSFSVPVSLLEGANTFRATATDGGNLSDTSTPLVAVGDITPPTASMEVVTVTSAGEATTLDKFFVIVAASDNLSGINSVIEVASGDLLVPIAEVPTILVRMHGLDKVGTNATTTHVMFSDVQPGTPVGVNTVNVRIIDNATNESTASGTLSVVSARSNRNYFLFPGVNFMGLALIPNDGNPATTDDSSLDRLMNQDVTSSVNPSLATALGGTVTLGDVIESTFAFNNAGNFIVHTPGSGAADTLTDLEPFQGMNIKTLELASVSTSTQIAVFDKVNVEGFTAQQAVPIRVNIEGVFFTPGELPPDKVLRVGYNLIAPHILADSLFDTVFRGALIPKQLAVSAITFQRRVDVVLDGSAIQAEILEGFGTNSLGDFLQPELSYWTFVVQDDPTNPTTPTITP